MRMTEIDYDGRVPIDGYGPGFFRINGEVVNGPILMGPDGASPWSGLSDFDAVASVFAGADVIFVGMGSDIAYLPEGVAEQLSAAGVSFEIMSTAAACRTYNVLLSEGRRIGAALIPVV